MACGRGGVGPQRRSGSTEAVGGGERYHDREHAEDDQVGNQSGYGDHGNDDGYETRRGSRMNDGRLVRLAGRRTR